DEALAGGEISGIQGVRRVQALLFSVAHAIEPEYRLVDLLIVPANTTTHVAEINHHRGAEMLFGLSVIRLIVHEQPLVAADEGDVEEHAALAVDCGFLDVHRDLDVSARASGTWNDHPIGKNLHIAQLDVEIG